MKTIKCKCGKDILVDDCDLEEVSKHSWNCSNNSVRKSLHRQSRIITHVINGRPSIGKVWDHIDLDIHNNQRTNLRLATRSQNGANRTGWSWSGYKGVTRLQDKFVARIKVQYKSIYLGTYSTAKEAAERYDRAAQHYFKEFAKTNS